MGIKNLWQWLRDGDNRGALQIIGGAIVAICTAAWAVFLFNNKQVVKKDITTPQKQTALRPQSVKEKVTSSPAETRPEHVQRQTEVKYQKGNIQDKQITLEKPNRVVKPAVKIRTIGVNGSANENIIEKQLVESEGVKNHSYYTNLPEESRRKQIDKFLEMNDLDQAIIAMKNLPSDDSRSEEAKRIFSFCLKSKQLEKAKIVTKFLDQSEVEVANQEIALEMLKGGSK